MTHEESIRRIIDNCGIENLKIYHEVSLRKLLTLRPEGVIPTLIIVESVKALQELFKFIMINDINYFIVGGGSNTLINDNKKDLVVIRLGKAFSNINFLKNGTISCGAAFKTGRFVTECFKESYDFSFLSGIPGTIGGGVAGNAGNGSNSICEFVDSLECLRLQFDRIVLENFELKKTDYDYRFLNIKNLLAITNIQFRKEKSEKEIIFDKIRNKLKYKKKVQPIEKFTAGCFFKNPLSVNKTAAQLIDSLGFKGFKYGGAAITKKHANFIENYHCATTDDIYNLSRIIYGAVKDNFNIKLENEVKLVGF